MPITRMFTTRAKRTLALRLVALAILLPLLAACGESDGSSGGSGAAAGGGSSAAAGGGAAGEDTDPYVKFARCMRQNGVPNWPDPIDGTKFRTKGIDPNSPQFKAAGQKCKSIAPPGWDGGSRQDPANQAKALKYAQCMRKNGVSEFPDPKGGSLDLSDVDSDSPQFKAADQKCESLRPSGGGG